MMAVVTKVLLLALFFYRCSADKVNGRFVPRYHAHPPHGWMNDPNGFCEFDGDYHLFYQYNPESSLEPGIAHWGHFKSTDLIHWENLPIAMYPDQPYDKNGVFSGSAVIENGTMYFLYTGNVNDPNVNWQALASSTDGVNVTKYAVNPVIIGDEHQPEFRDPKVWKHGNTFYTVLGNSYKNGKVGRILLYSSNDLISWEQKSVLDESDGTLGYMWECPDFFELVDRVYVLLFSPQGIEPQGDKYKNQFQTGYILGNFDYESNLFTPITEFRELDHGHDFYATQTMLDDSGRRIVVAWQNMWDRVYPERNDGWAGQITIPRELSLSQDYRILQNPIKELHAARGCTLYSGKAEGGHTVKLEDKAGEIQVRAAKFQNFKIYIYSGNDTAVSISYDYMEGKVTLDRGDEDDIRRTKWRPKGKFLTWQIYVDASSIELFCGEGEVTFSSRFFPYNKDVYVMLDKDVQAEELTVYEMQRTVDVPDEF